MLLETTIVKYFDRRALEYFSVAYFEPVIFAQVRSKQYNFLVGIIIKIIITMRDWLKLTPSNSSVRLHGEFNVFGSLKGPISGFFVAKPRNSSG